MNKSDWADLLMALAVIVVLLIPAACETGFSRMGVMPT